MFSHLDCRIYGYLTNTVSSICVNNTLIYNTERDLKEGITHFDYFADCLLFCFMTEFGAKRSCSTYSMVSDSFCLSYRSLTELDASRTCTKYSIAPESNTNDENSISLLSKDHLFYVFLIDKLNVRNSCPNSHVPFDNNTTVLNGLFSTSSCNWYLQHNN